MTEDSDIGTSTSTSTGPVRVGIIGVGGWAEYGHLPALESLADVEIVAVSSRSPEKAQKLAVDHGIPHAFTDYHDLIAHPDVDLVVIPAPAPAHAELVTAAIAAGKDVLSEWPLTTTTADSERLLALAGAAGVRHVVALQRRFSPSARFTRDLIASGHVGHIRGVTMSVGINSFGPTQRDDHTWVLDPATFVSLIPVYLGHFGDLLFSTLGWPASLTAVTENQFPTVTLTPSGLPVDYPVPTEAMIIGTLEGGGLFSIQLEGGQARRTGLQMQITGTDGVLRISNPRGYESEHDNLVESMAGDETSFTPLVVPDAYQTLSASPLDATVPDATVLDATVLDVAHLYDAYVRDVRTGTSTVTDFADAVRMHRIIDAVTATATAFHQHPGASPVRAP